MDMNDKIIAIKTASTILAFEDTIFSFVFDRKFSLETLISFGHSEANAEKLLNDSQERVLKFFNEKFEEISQTEEYKAAIEILNNPENFIGIEL